jgi:acetolactate synthase I/II/III large subunit
MNVAEFLISVIHRMGTDTAFCLTGGMAMHINRAIDESSMQVIYCNHEQAVAAAADGYAKAKNYLAPGLAVVTSGPGVMNTVNSVASAYQDSVPMYIVAGQVKTDDINRFGLRSLGAQEAPQLEMLAFITKCAFRYDPKHVTDDELAVNLAQAMAGRKGPVYVDIPLDIQPQKIENFDARLDSVMKRIRSILDADVKTESLAAQTISSALVQAKRPVLVVGNGFRIGGVKRDELRSLVEELGIPTLFTWASTDLLEYDHLLHFGCAGGLAPTHSNRIIQSADLLVFIGVRLDLLTTAYNPQNYGKNAKRLVVECDACEIQKNDRLKNTTFFLEDLRSVIGVLRKTRPAIGSVNGWLAECAEWRMQDQREEDRVFATSVLTTYQMARVLSHAPNANYIVPTASGFATEGFLRFFRPGRDVTSAIAGHCLGSMGLGLPMAIGAAAALKQRVICLEGDGGLLLNVQELFTIAANPQLSLTLIVMNNGGYQSIMKSQGRAFGKEFGSSKDSGLCETNFSAIAAMVNLPYLKATSVAEFERIMVRDGSPDRCLIELTLHEDGYRGPSVTTKFDERGKPYSTDIGDVAWTR